MVLHRWPHYVKIVKTHSRIHNSLRTTKEVMFALCCPCPLSPQSRLPLFEFPIQLPSRRLGWRDWGKPRNTSVWIPEIWGEQLLGSVFERYYVRISPGIGRHPERDFSSFPPRKEGESVSVIPLPLPLKSLPIYYPLLILSFDSAMSTYWRSR
jgi:hypothetical protein